jgi:hypothetical protein
MSKQKICHDSHEEIIYSGDVCPLCIQREAMDAMLDERVDIDQQNIADIYRELKEFRRWRKKADKILFPNEQPSLWHKLLRPRQISTNKTRLESADASIIVPVQQTRETGSEIGQALEFDS